MNTPIFFVFFLYLDFIRRWPCTQSGNFGRGGEEERGEGLALAVDSDNWDSLSFPSLFFVIHYMHTHTYQLYILYTEYPHLISPCMAACNLRLSMRHEGVI